MTDAKGPPANCPEELQRILRCGKCGKTVTCQQPEMLAYTVARVAKMLRRDDDSFYRGQTASVE